jgi:hypothetical protein
MSEFMTTEEVCGRLSRAGIDTKTVSKIFAARLEPEKLDELDKTIETYRGVVAVPEPGGRVFLVVYKFGTGAPLPQDPTIEIPQETGPDRRPRWISVNGPYQLDLIPGPKPGTQVPDPECELLRKAKELTNG